MENKFNVIKGSFKPDEAKEILMTLINKKIDFHNLKNLSSQIRYNKADPNSQERMIALKEISNRIKELVKQAKEDNCDLSIDSSIHLALVPAKELEKETK